MRECLLGPRRYSELLAALPGLTTNLLAKRLRQLEEDGLLERRSEDASGRWHAYALTELGRELEPVVLALGRFGERFLSAQAMNGDDRKDPRWFMTSLKRRYLGSPPRTPPHRLSLRIAGADFHVALTHPQLTVGDGADRLPDARIEAETIMGLAAWIRGLAPRSALEESGRLRCTGDEAALNAFVSSFLHTDADED